MRTDIVRNEVAICEPASRLATIQTLAVRSKICLHGRLHIRIHAHIGCGITKHYQRRNRRRRGYNTAAAKWQHHQQQNEGHGHHFLAAVAKTDPEASSSLSLVPLELCRWNGGNYGLYFVVI